MIDLCPIKMASFLWTILFTCLIHLDVWAQTGSSGPAGPLNILVIMADDLGAWATGPYGNREVRTPHLNRLAANGTKFNFAFTVSPVCSPSRASFFTGRLPSQHGVHDFISETPEFDKKWLKNETLLPELLQDNGYQTALIGKWHCSADSRKVQKGFDRWVSYDVKPEGWQNQYQHSGKIHFSNQGETVSIEGYQSEYLTSQALDFLTNRPPDTPFFLYLGFVDTHFPFSGQPERLVQSYRNATFEDVPISESSHLPASGPASEIPDDHREQLAQYYAGVTMMDEQVGALLQYLENRSLLENTLIIFTSDQGHLNGHHGLYGKGNATQPQNFFEESVRIPLVLHWPSGLRSQGNEIDIPVDHMDLFNTILDAAGVQLSAGQRQSINSPGKSVLPILLGTDTTWRKYQYSEYGNARMVRGPQFKLVKRYEPIKTDFGDELFDLKNDPRETINLNEDPAFQDRVVLMNQELEKYFAQYESERHTGREILKQEAANHSEPWRK